VTRITTNIVRRRLLVGTGSPFGPHPNRLQLQPMRPRLLVTRGAERGTPLCRCHACPGLARMCASRLIAAASRSMSLSLYFNVSDVMGLQGQRTRVPGRAATHREGYDAVTGHTSARRKPPVDTWL